MAFKPNYNQQRAERNRAKQAKRDEKRKLQEERTAQRKAQGLGPEPEDGPPRGERGQGVLSCYYGLNYAPSPALRSGRGDGSRTDRGEGLTGVVALTALTRPPSLRYGGHPLPLQSAGEGNRSSARRRG